MNLFDSFFGHEGTLSLHGDLGDTHLHMHTDGLGGHNLMDDGGHLLGHTTHDPMGHLQFQDAHGLQLGAAHSDALGHTVFTDAHGAPAGGIHQGALGDLFSDSGVHLGHMGHDLSGNPLFTTDPLIQMGHAQFPHFLP